MDWDDYQRRAIFTAREHASREEHEYNVAFGLIGELGEITELLKKHYWHGHALDTARLTKELGDFLWYIAYGANLAGTGLNVLIAKHPIQATITRTADSAKQRILFLTGAISDYFLELGDTAAKQKLVLVLYWWRTLVLALGLDESEIAAMNLEKLEARYPAGFDPALSQNRTEE